MIRMNKIQKQVYNWLLEHPGYLKKGPWAIWSALAIGQSDTDVKIALKQARIDFKPSKSIYKVDIRNDQVTALKESTFAFKQSSKKTPYKNVLAIADAHEPFCKQGYLEHCMAIAKKYNCNEFVNIGDEVDLCGVSQWEKDPDGFSAGTEADLAQKKMQLWYEAFPNMKVCIGNHTARPFRMAKSNGVPKKFIKSYKDAWEAPEGWNWADHWEIDGVLYTHGTGFSGPNAAIRIATRHRQNTVIGHIHSEAGIQYSASKIDLVWGMQLGGALDDKSYAAYYAKDQLKKSIVGCGVILEGKLPIYEPMLL